MKYVSGEGSVLITWSRYSRYNRFSAVSKRMDLKFLFGKETWSNFNGLDFTCSDVVRILKEEIHSSQKNHQWYIESPDTRARNERFVRPFCARNLSNFRSSMGRDPSDALQVAEPYARNKLGTTEERKKMTSAGLRRNDTLRNPLCIRNAMNKHYYDRILRPAGLAFP